MKPERKRWTGIAGIGGIVVIMCATGTGYAISTGDAKTARP
jgi:hypothetical protein